MKISRRDFFKKFAAMAAAGTMGLMPTIGVKEEIVVDEPAVDEAEYDYPPTPYFIDGGSSSHGQRYAPWFPGMMIQCPDPEHPGRFIDAGEIK